MESIAIIADDLTGANDTAMQFSKYGFQTTVIISFDHVNHVEVNCEPKVFSINAVTRNLSASEAYERVHLVTCQLLAAGVKRFYKKIDSTLRGHPGAELEAAMDALNAKLGLVVPAFPANNRAQIGGYLVVSPVLTDDISENKCHAPTVLQREMKRPVTLVDLKVVRQGPEELVKAIDAFYKQDTQVLIFDAETEADLNIIAHACSRLPEDILISGAAGLAAHLPPVWGTRSVSANQTIPTGVTLTVIGSRNPTSAAQLKNLLAEKKTAVVKVCANEILCGDVNNEIMRCSNQAALLLNEKKSLDSLLLTVDTVLDPNLYDPSTMNTMHNEAIASALGHISLDILSRRDINSLVVGGGDTAYQLCLALSARQIDLIIEILPGIPLGRLVGGVCEGLLVVTKAGGFGPPDALLQVVNFLKGNSYKGGLSHG